MDIEQFYKENMSFVNYSSEHFAAVVGMFFIGLLFLYVGKYKWNSHQKWRNAIIVCAFVYSSQILKVFIKLGVGDFDITTDLPLHLCNLLPLFMLIGLIKKSKLILSVLFFWILAGTAQANITPTLSDAFPHYEAFRYWLIHMGLPILAVYTFYVLGMRFTFKDAVRSALCLNLLAAVMYPINILLGSNYMYLVAKPEGATIYNLLGPWPWYIMNLELLMLVLFSVVLIPFVLYDKYRGGVSNGKR